MKEERKESKCTASKFVNFANIRRMQFSLHIKDIKIVFSVFQLKLKTDDFFISIRKRHECRISHDENPQVGS